MAPSTGAEIEANRNAANPQPLHASDLLPQQPSSEEDYHDVLERDDDLCIVKFELSQRPSVSEDAEREAADPEHGLPVDDPHECWPEFCGVCPEFEENVPRRVASNHQCQCNGTEEAGRQDSIHMRFTARRASRRWEMDAQLGEPSFGHRTSMSCRS